MACRAVCAAGGGPRPLATIRAASRPDHRAADMAALEASASRPGLVGRIESYLGAGLKK